MPFACVLFPSCHRPWRKVWSCVFLAPQIMEESLEVIGYASRLWRNSVSYAAYFTGVKKESGVCSQFQEEIVEVTQFFLKRACRTNRCCSRIQEQILQVAKNIPQERVHVPRGADCGCKYHRSCRHRRGHSACAECRCDGDCDLVPQIPEKITEAVGWHVVSHFFSCDGCFGFFSCAGFAQHMGLNAALAKARNVLAAASRSLCAKRLDKTTRMEVCEKRHVQCLAQHDVKNVQQNMGQRQRQVLGHTRKFRPPPNAPEMRQEKATARPATTLKKQSRGRRRLSKLRRWQDWRKTSSPS